MVSPGHGEEMMSEEKIPWRGAMRALQGHAQLEDRTEMKADMKKN